MDVKVWGHVFHLLQLQGEMPVKGMGWVGRFERIKELQKSAGDRKV